MVTWTICMGEPITSSHKEANLIILEPESDLQAQSQLSLSMGSDPRSALITGNVWVLKCQSPGELILDQRSRQWLCNEAQWEASDEEFPWWRGPLRLQKQRTAGNQEVQPEAVSCLPDCSIFSRYLLIMQLHFSAQTPTTLQNTVADDSNPGKMLWEESWQTFKYFCM